MALSMGRAGLVLQSGWTTLGGCGLNRVDMTSAGELLEQAVSGS